MPTKIATASFTRPADTIAYAAGDLVANSTTAGSVVPMNFTSVLVADRGGMVRAARMSKSGLVTSDAQFRLHLYGAEPTPTNGDNGAWLTDQAAGYIGSIDITLDKAFSDGVAGRAPVDAEAGPEFNYGEGVNALYGVIAALADYVPASAEVFTVSLELLVN